MEGCKEIIFFVVCMLSFPIHANEKISLGQDLDTFYVVDRKNIQNIPFWVVEGAVEEISSDAVTTLKVLKNPSELGKGLRFMGFVFLLDLNQALVTRKPLYEGFIGHSIEHWLKINSDRLWSDEPREIGRSLGQVVLVASVLSGNMKNMKPVPATQKAIQVTRAELIPVYAEASIGVYTETRNGVRAIERPRFTTTQAIAAARKVILERTKPTPGVLRIKSIEDAILFLQTKWAAKLGQVNNQIGSLLAESLRVKAETSARQVPGVTISSFVRKPMLKPQQVAQLSRLLQELNQLEVDQRYLVQRCNKLQPVFSTKKLETLIHDLLYQNDLPLRPLSSQRVGELTAQISQFEEVQNALGIHN